MAFFAKERTLPLTMGLLIDTSGSEAEMIGAEQQAAIQFLQRVMQKRDEALVITFDLDVDLLADWTNDVSELDRAIRRARINAPSSARHDLLRGHFPPAVPAEQIFMTPCTSPATTKWLPKPDAKR